MCDSLEVSRSGYYDWLNRKPSARKKFNYLLLQVIKEIHLENDEVYGSIRIHREVLKKGYCCSLRLVEKLMRIANITSKIKAKYRISTTNSNHSYAVSENKLKRNFKAEKPGEVWVSDITYVEVGSRWMYLCIIMDLYNREIVGWDLSETLEATSLLNAFQNATNLHKLKPGGIFHSDRGIQYASKEFRSILEKHNIIQSMSRKGDCWDNAPAESFFKTLKMERIYHVKYQNYQQAKSDLFYYIELFYNRRRSHSYLNFTNPVDYRKMYYKRAS